MYMYLYSFTCEQCKCNMSIHVVIETTWTIYTYTVWWSHGRGVTCKVVYMYLRWAWHNIVWWVWLGGVLTEWATILSLVLDTALVRAPKHPGWRPVSHGFLRRSGLILIRWPSVVNTYCANCLFTTLSVSNNCWKWKHLKHTYSIIHCTHVHVLHVHSLSYSTSNTY